MEYKGTWDASTNTPTLVNGTGNQGDVYLCNVAGTVNFGAGPIAFFVGDQVIYSGTIWQRASGASGTVTSVAVTESGDALTITGSPITTSGTINIGFAGTNLQYINGAGGLTTFPSLTGFVPYTGATGNVDLGTFNLTADVITGATGSFTSNGGSNTFAINHSSGAGIALNITKGGNNEGLYINKTSGSGNAATIVGTLEATTLVKTGGTSSQFLKADGSVDSTSYGTGSVTSVAALTLGTTGTDVSSSVANSTTTPVITLNIPDASASARGLITTGTQTISGLKTFSGLSVNIAPTSGDGGILNLKRGAYTGGINDYTSLISQGDNFGIASFTSSSNRSILFDFASITSGILRTYTLPNDSGTLALTSNLSSYVPYTGATGNVDLGANDLTARYLNGKEIYINKNGSFGGALFIETGTGFSYGAVNGIALASGTSENLNIISDVAGATKIANISLGSLSATRTYTLPNASGTIALTSDLTTGYVPYINATANVDLGTFNLSTLGTLLSKYVYVVGDGTNSGFLSFSQYATPDLSGTNATSIYTTSNNKVNFRFWQSGVSYKNFNFDVTSLTAGSNITFTLPDLSGTLALGTGTTNYVSKFTGTNTIGNSLIFDNGTNVGIGNTNTSYTLDVSGSLRNTTSAYFATTSGSVGIGMTTAPYGIVSIKSNNTSAYYGLNVFANGNANFTYVNHDNSVGIIGTEFGVGGSHTPLTFQSGGSERMRITSGGEVFIATTSNPVGASSGAGGWSYSPGSFQAIATNDGVSMYLNRISTDGAILVFRKNGSNVGSISTNSNSLPSDLNFKKNISNLQLGLNLVTKLRAVSYNHKIDDDDAALSTGFIAQELEQSLTELGVKENEYYILQHQPNEDEKQSQYWLDYTKMIPILVKAIQEMNTKSEEQQALITSLQSQINELKNK
jgi:hypothetical protein